MKSLSFSSAELIEKGWSGDRKYHVTEADGTEHLLRLSPPALFERRKEEFARMQKAAALNLPMCMPEEFGVCSACELTDGSQMVYSLQSWIHGKDLEGLLHLLPETQQYVLGLRAGSILQKLHSIPAPESLEPWEERFNRKIDRNLLLYAECPIKAEGADRLIDYLEKNRGLLSGRPQSFQHGDYHVGNMMLAGTELVLIDFDRSDFGDPWEEFNRIVWCAQESPLFASGMVNGYFNGAPPALFWKLLALYIASNTLSSIPWALPFGEKEIDVMMRQMAEVLSWYDGMTKTIPSWYMGELCLQYADGVPYQLKAPFDFSFLTDYGKVFQIFDLQDSGNICFGAEGNHCKQYFLKFAGAPTACYEGSLTEAVKRLEASVKVYRDLAHPSLIRLVEAKEIGSGFLAVFDWTNGECLGRMYPLSRQKFLAMPEEIKLQVYRDILVFHEHVIQKGYVAVDFYDSSILYDFNQKKTMLCDIDFYRRAPAVNDMGRMWGSSRFMSPEEFELGSPLDEVTNVYAMGAAAFALFADCSRKQEDWPLTKKAFQAVQKAVNPDRRQRQQTIRQLREEFFIGLRGENPSAESGKNG